MEVVPTHYVNQGVLNRLLVSSETLQQLNILACGSLYEQVVEDSMIIEEYDPLEEIQ
jgi:hypothetical protein